MEKADSKKVHGALTGKIVSEKGEKTRIVEVQTRKSHPVYKKTYNVSKRFVVHDAEGAFHLGDMVTFVPSRPYSATKRFIIIGKDSGTRETPVSLNQGAPDLEG